jgi:hypothetical protein
MEPMRDYLPVEEIHLEEVMSVGPPQGRRFLHDSLVIVVLGDYIQFGDQRCLDNFKTFNF